MLVITTECIFNALGEFDAIIHLFVIPLQSKCLH